MRYRRLGGSGLKLSELTLGSWLTFGPRVDEAGARASVRLALEKGVNSFDTAETYADGAAEELLGRAIEGIRRESLVVATKLFWGGPGPNDVGLSRKRIVEGTRGSLRRLRLDYVDLLYCHRPDPDTPIEETVRAMDSVVRSGQALYWGTSEWPASAIEEAYRVAKELGCAPPTMEQSKHHLFARARLDELSPLVERRGLGVTTYSPLAHGLLTGKYEAGIPAGSRLDAFPHLRAGRTDEAVAAARRLGALARELGATPAQLAIAWCLGDRRVSSVIVAATTPEQLRENLEVAERPELDEETLHRIASV